jgi:hypothetical protein
LAHFVEELGELDLEGVMGLEEIRQLALQSAIIFPQSACIQ